MGIRKRIILGFSVIGLLLLLAGVVSYFELERINQTTVNHIEQGSTGVATARQLLDCLESQDALLLELMIYGYTDQYHESSHILTSRLDSILTQSHNQLLDFTQPLIGATRDYIKTVESLPFGSKESQVNWYLHEYRPAYGVVASKSKDFIVDTQEAMVSQARALKASAYRANMQCITALAAAALLLFVFFFMVDIYFVTPVVSITKSLKKYLQHKVPFNIQIEGREEVAQLKELIIQMISRKNS